MAKSAVITGVEDQLAAVMRKLENCVDEVNSLKEGLASISDRVSALEAAGNRGEQRAEGVQSLPPIIQEFKDLKRRLSALEKSPIKRNQIKSDGGRPSTPEYPTSPLTPPPLPPISTPAATDSIEEAKKFDAKIDLFKQQLANLEVRIETVNLESRETFEKLHSQLRHISERERPEYDRQVDEEVIMQTMTKVEQLNVLYTGLSRQNSSAYEELRAVCDVLAENSFSSQAIAKIECLLQKMMQMHVGAAEFDDVLDSIRLNSNKIRELNQRLDQVEAKSVELNDFIATLEKSGDDKLQMTFHQQKCIVHMMNRECNQHKQQLDHEIASRRNELRESIADLSIKVIKSASPSALSSWPLDNLSMQWRSNINVSQLNRATFGIKSLSLYDDLLLVGAGGKQTLYVYSTAGLPVLSISLPGNDTLCDAAWLNHRGQGRGQARIVCTTDNSQKVVVMTQKGEVVSENCQLYCPRRICVAYDNSAVYLADLQKGVYQSTDSCQSWSHVFSVPEADWTCRQVVRVPLTDLGPRASTSSAAAAAAAAAASSPPLLLGKKHQNPSGVSFWTLEKHREPDGSVTKAGPQRLRIYTLLYPPSPGSRAGGDVGAKCSLTWRDVVLPSLHFSLNECRLAYDSVVNAIYLSDFDNNIVHKFTVTGEHKKPFVSRTFVDSNKPRSLVVDCERGLLYVGQQDVIGVFQLLRNGASGGVSNAT